MSREIHPIDPVYDENSRILILGSFPSVQSRRVGFFYGHPQNRFWRVLAALFDAPLPQTTKEKIAFLHANHIALWDVLKECDITGSADSSIGAAIPNDVTPILQTAPHVKIAVNGKTALRYYRRFLQKQTGIEPIVLPSTSPANAAKSLEALIALWREALL